jgi:hypothetical protein
MATKKKAAPKKTAPKKPQGLYSESVVDAICHRIGQGESLVKICKTPGLPSRSVFMGWLLQNKHPGLQDKYARAREAQADFYAEEIIEISDEESLTTRHSKPNEDGEVAVEVVFDATAVARNRLRVDARKWYASKVAPKKYGEKQEVVLTGKIDIAAGIMAARKRAGMAKQ